MNKSSIAMHISTAAFLTAFTVYAAPKPKTLVFMLDGVRSDSIENACTPNIKKLIDGKWQKGYRCAWTFAAQTVPDALSSSAPNHASIALGVSAAKNNVINNGYFGKCDYKKWPSWLVRIAETIPNAKTLFMYSWKADKDLCPNPNVEFIWSRATASRMGFKKGTMRTCDRANGIELARRLASDNAPDASLVFFDCPDWGGHGLLKGEGVGFYPYSTGYLGAVNECDGIIGRCLDTIAKRSTFKDEDWLIIVVSDHGGYATTHGLKGGHATAIPIIVSSKYVSQGRIPGTPCNYDIAPTVLAHFGINYSGFGLDGKALGMKTVTDKVRSPSDGLAVYLPFDGTKIENAITTGPKPEARGNSVISAKGGYIAGCLTLAAGTNEAGCVCLKGSESLKFENGGDFTMTMWVRTDKPQKGDSLILGNKNWRSGNNPGIAFCAAKRTERVKKPGVVLNTTVNKASKRIDIGTYDIEYSKWTFYAMTRDRDGVTRLYQGAPNGWLYCIYENTANIDLVTGMPFFIGQDGTGRYGCKFEGRIDDFALWTRTLVHDEIKRIFECGRKGVSVGDILAAN